MQAEALRLSALEREPSFGLVREGAPGDVQVGEVKQRELRRHGAGRERSDGPRRDENFYAAW